MVSSYFEWVKQTLFRAYFCFVPLPFFPQIINSSQNGSQGDRERIWIMPANSSTCGKYYLRNRTIKKKHNGIWGWTVKMENFQLGFSGPYGCISRENCRLPSSWLSSLGLPAPGRSVFCLSRDCWPDMAQSNPENFCTMQGAATIPSPVRSQSLSWRGTPHPLPNWSIA